MSIIVQPDATVYSLSISGIHSTCFGWYLHPSSGAHITVSTLSGISKTVTATCRKRDWMGTVPIESCTRQVAVTVSLMPDSVDAVRMDIQEVGCGYMDWIGLAQDRDRWRTLVSAVMNLRVP